MARRATSVEIQVTRNPKSGACCTKCRACMTVKEHRKWQVVCLHGFPLNVCSRFSDASAKRVFGQEPTP